MTVSQPCLVPLVDDPAALGPARRPGRPAPNIYRALANVPELLAAWTGLAWPLRSLTDAPRGDRELAITHLATLRGSTYVETHHRRFAARHGIDASALAVLGRRWRDGGDTAPFTAAQRTVLAAVDDVVDGGAVTEEVVRLLEEHYGRRGMVHLVVTIAFYDAVCVVNRTLRVPLEPGV